MEIMRSAFDMFLRLTFNRFPFPEPFTVHFLIIFVRFHEQLEEARNKRKKEKLPLTVIEFRFSSRRKTTKITGNIGLNH